MITTSASARISTRAIVTTTTTTTTTTAASPACSSTLHFLSLFQQVPSCTFLGLNNSISKCYSTSDPTATTNSSSSSSSPTTPTTATTATTPTTATTTSPTNSSWDDFLLQKTIKTNNFIANLKLHGEVSKSKSTQFSSSLKNNSAIQQFLSHELTPQTKKDFLALIHKDKYWSREAFIASLPGFVKSWVSDQSVNTSNLSEVTLINSLANQLPPASVIEWWSLENIQTAPDHLFIYSLLSSTLENALPKTNNNNNGSPTITTPTPTPTPYSSSTAKLLTPWVTKLTPNKITLQPKSKANKTNETNETKETNTLKSVSSPSTPNQFTLSSYYLTDVG